MKYIILLFFLFTSNVYAYSKDDIVNLTDSISVCSSSTSSMINGFKKSYIRMLNERDISDSNLNLIYNNLSDVINILNRNNVCSLDDKDRLSDGDINKLYSLYKETNNIIVSSPKIGSSNNDSSVVIDTSKEEIKVYEDGVLTDVIKNSSKLNYVGLNKVIKYFIYILVLLLILIIILGLFKSSIILRCLFYVVIILLPIVYGFRDDLSMFVDFVQGMKNVKTVERQATIEDKRVVKYPSYGTNYGNISINKKEENIYYGDSSSILKKGIGQVASNTLPGSGSIVLSGHNTGLFKELFNIKKGNNIIIKTSYGKFTYIVKSKKVTKDTDISSINKDYDLILYTCYPNSDIYSSSRLVVYADISKEVWFDE